MCRLMTPVMEAGRSQVQGHIGERTKASVGSIVRHYLKLERHKDRAKEKVPGKVFG